MIPNALQEIVNEHHSVGHLQSVTKLGYGAYIDTALLSHQFAQYAPTTVSFGLNNPSLPRTTRRTYYMLLRRCREVAKGVGDYFLREEAFEYFVDVFPEAGQLYVSSLSHPIHFPYWKHEGRLL